MDLQLIGNMEKNAKYNYVKFSDLLRFIRNALSHPEVINTNQHILGGKTDAHFIRYVSLRFPWLFIFAEKLVNDFGKVYPNLL